METNKTIKFADFPKDEQNVVTRLQVTYSQQADTISPTGEDNSITKKQQQLYEQFRKRYDEKHK